MVRKLNAEILEQYDKPQREVHWMRHRKAKIDFFDESPFAIDRQLEDQKEQMKFNRNPQLTTMMKADVPRSNKMFETKDSEDSLTIKANVVNKIVRQASGINSYALVPPPKSTEKKKIVEEIDPDTHPRLKAYAKEATSKPIICSFGHRPRSASRTFHPATMRVKLKHSEVVKSEEGKTGFGLSVAVLSKLLYAPKLYPASAVDDEDALTNFFGSTSLTTQKSYPKAQTAPAAFDPTDLFSMPDGSLAGDSGGPSAERDTDRKIRKKKAKQISSSIHDPTRVEPIGSISLAPLSSTGGIDRPLWNEGFHTVEHPPKEKYSMRQSVITEGSQEMPFNKRLQRFATLTVAEKQLMPTCQERQVDDLHEMTGDKIQVKRSQPVKGQVLYFDPLDKQLGDVKSYREILVQQREDRIRAKLYQNTLETIPDVSYNAISAIQQMHRGSLGSLSIAEKSMSDGTMKSRSSKQMSIPGNSGNASVTSEEVHRAALEGLNSEGFHKALKKAKKGNTDALYQYFIGTEKRASIAEQGSLDDLSSIETKAALSTKEALQRSVKYGEADASSQEDAINSYRSPADSAIAELAKGSTKAKKRSDSTSSKHSGSDSARLSMTSSKTNDKYGASSTKKKAAFVDDEEVDNSFDDDVVGVHGYKTDNFYDDYHAAILRGNGDNEEEEEDQF